MSKPQLRCSSLPLFFACNPAVLNPDKLRPVESENEAAYAGTEVHALTEAYAKTGNFDLSRLKAKLSPEDYDRAGKLMRNFTEVYDEIKRYMPNPDTEVYLEADAGRVVLTGHLDLLQINEKDAYLVDYKTGRQHENHYHQMAGYAFMVWQKAGSPVKFTVYATAVYLEDKTVTPYAFTYADLVQWRVELEAQVNRPLYTAGRKCAGCKLNGSCKAYREWAGGAVAVFDEGFTVGSKVWESFTPEERGEILDRVYVVEKAAERVKLSLRNYVKAHGPVDVGDGKEYTLVEETSEFLDAPKARKVLARVLPLPVLNKISRINLDEALTAYQGRAAKGTKMAARQRLYAALDKAGAIIRSKGSRMWRRPKGEKKLESK